MCSGTRSPGRSTMPSGKRPISSTGRTMPRVRGARRGLDRDGVRLAELKAQCANRLVALVERLAQAPDLVRLVGRRLGLPDRSSMGLDVTCRRACRRLEAQRLRSTGADPAAGRTLLVRSALQPVAALDLAAQAVAEAAFELDLEPVLLGEHVLDDAVCDESTRLDDLAEPASARLAFVEALGQLLLGDQAALDEQPAQPGRGGRTGHVHTVGRCAGELERCPSPAIIADARRCG